MQLVLDWICLLKIKGLCDLTTTSKVENEIWHNNENNNKNGNYKDDLIINDNDNDENHGIAGNKRKKRGWSDLTNKKESISFETTQNERRKRRKTMTVPAMGTLRMEETEMQEIETQFNKLLQNHKSNTENITHFKQKLNQSCDNMVCVCACVIVFCFLCSQILLRLQENCWHEVLC